MKHTDREKEIGARLRGWREERDLSQAGTAHSLGLTRDQIASIELGRVPMRWEIANRFCLKYGVNQRWLATGAEPESPYVNVPSEIFEGTETFSFSSIYDTMFAPYCDAFFKLNLWDVRNKIVRVSYARPLGQSGPGSPEQEGEILGKAIKEAISIVCDSVPASRYGFFYDRVRQACIHFIDEAGPAIQEWRKESGHTVREKVIKAVLEETSMKNSLPIYSDSSTVETAMSKPITSWPELRERLIALTSERGAKAALAREFNVSPQAVGEWVRGKSMPSADATIRLLPWVAAKECEAAGKVKATAKRKPAKTTAR